MLSGRNSQNSGRISFNSSPIKSGRRSSYNDSSFLSKSLKNISEFTPLQAFQKHFTLFENQMVKLRQSHAPYGIERIFEVFNSLKSRYPAFLSSCSTINKRIQLNNSAVEVSVDAQDLCRVFSLDFGDLLASLAQISSSIPSLYQSNLGELAKDMRYNITRYANACFLDHRTRFVFQNYDTFFKQNLDQCQNDFDFFLTHNNFEEITVDKMQHIIERYKQVSRKFEMELPHAMSLQRLTVPNGDSFIRSFHTDFVTFIPLLTGIPNFMAEFKLILEQIPLFGQSLQDLIESLGLRAPSTQSSPLPKSRSITESGLSEEFPPHDEEPYLVYIPKILELLQIEQIDDFYEQQDYVYQQIIDRIREVLNLHENEKHQMQTKINALSNINDNSTIAERTLENQQYKDDLKKQFETEKEAMYREVLDNIKSLTPKSITSPNDDTKTQIQCVVTCVHEELEQLHHLLNQYETEIKKSKEILKDLRDIYLGMETDDDEYLPNTIDNTIQAMENTKRSLDQQLKDINPTNNILEVFLHDTLIQFCKKKPTELKNLTIDRMKEMVGRHILDLDEEIKKLKDKLKEVRDSKKELEDKVISELSQIRYKLEEQLNNTEETNLDIDDLLTRIKALLQQHDSNEKDRIAFRQFLSSFLSQLLLAFHLQQIRFRNATDQQLKNVMTSILDTPDIQKLLSGQYNNLSSNPSTTNLGYSAPQTPKTIPRRRNSVTLTPSSLSQSAREKRFTREGMPPAPPSPAKAGRRPSVVISARTPNTASNPVFSNVSRRGSESSRRASTMDPENEKILGEIKTLLAESCAILEDRTAASYMYFPLDQLAKQIKQLCTNIINTRNSTKSLVCDIIIEMNDKQKITKEELLKQNNNDLFEYIFQGLHLIKQIKTDLTEETIRNMCRGVTTDDVDFLDIPSLVTLSKNQLRLIKETAAVITPLTNIIKDINDQVNINKSFNPLSDLFPRYVQKVESLSREFILVTADNVLPAVLPYVSQSVSLIDHITKILSATTYAAENKDVQSNIETLMSENQEYKLKIEDLEKNIKDVEKERDLAKQKLFNVLEASRAAANARINAIKKVNTDDLGQIIEYFKNHADDDDIEGEN